MQAFGFVAGLALAGGPASGQQVIQLTWPTRHAAEPVAVSEDQRPWMPALQFAMASLPEESVVSLALAQGSVLGLENSDARRLQLLFSNYYARVRRTDSFRSAPSALPYCFSTIRPANGMATVYIPRTMTPQTRTIVFLHGYGGSLIAYVHYLANTFSNDVVICPAYGVAPATLPSAYLDEALNAAARRLKRARDKPILIGLSAGGVGACRVYAANPAGFARLICLGSIPPADATVKFNSGKKVSFISGSREPHVVDGSLERQLKQMRSRGADVTSQTITGADHFFLLSHETETRTALLHAVRSSR